MTFALRSIFRLGRRLALLILISGAGALEAQIGGLDASFNAPAILNGAAPGVVKALAVQSDGRTIIAGDFTSVGGTARGRIARLNHDGSLDATFATGLGADGIINAVALQTDGRILIGGDFLNFSGTGRARIARLTTAGALDTAFNPGTGANGVVNALAIFGDSSVYLGGNFTTIAGTTRNRVAQLSSSGAVTSFNVGTGPNAPVLCVALAGEFGNNLYLGGAFTTFSGSARSRLAAVNTFNGSLASFNATGGPDGLVSAMAIQLAQFGSEGGSLFIAGDFSTVSGLARPRVARLAQSYSSEGFAIDGAFNVWVDAPVRCLAIYPTNYASNSNPRPLLIGGEFTIVNGQPRNRLARVKSFSFNLGLSTAQYWDLDASYGTSAGVNGTILAAVLPSDERAVIGGQFSSVEGTPTAQVARLYNDAGILPPAAPTGLIVAAPSVSQVVVTFFSSANATSYKIERSSNGVDGWNVVATQSSTLNFTRFIDSSLAAGTAYFYRVSATNANGSSAPTAVVSATTAATEWMGAGALDPTAQGVGTNGAVNAVVIQPDGSTLLAGTFTTVHGVARKNIARLLPDWTVDPSFNPGTGPDSTVNDLALQPDGAVVIVGGFSNVAGVARKYVARLTSTGALDPSFAIPETGPSSLVQEVALQSDGRIVIAGYFSTINGSPRSGIARLEASGAVDPAFQAVVSISSILSLSVQRDDRIVLGGTFFDVNGFDISYAARLLRDGQVDFSFLRPGNPAFVYSAAALNSGKVLLGGSFFNSSTQRTRIERLNTDGSLDATFHPGVGPNSTVTSVAPQADGKVLIAGYFTTVADVLRPSIARLNADGTLDATFQPGAGTFSTINAVAVGADTRIVVAGSFSTFGTGTRGNIVRLRGDGHAAPPPIPAGLAVTAVSATSLLVSWSDLPAEQGWRLERSLDGLSGWDEIARVPWDVTTFPDTGLAPATDYFYRLRANNSAGNSDYSASATGRTYSLFSQWKIDRGLALSATDDSDGDRDGIPLLVEYGLGLDPGAANVAEAPVFELFDGVLAMSYRKLRDDVSYSVEASPDLQIWSAAGVQQGSGAYPIAWREIGEAGRLFLRLRVSRP